MLYKLNIFGKILFFSLMLTAFAHADDKPKPTEADMLRNFVLSKEPLPGGGYLVEGVPKTGARKGRPALNLQQKSVNNKIYDDFSEQNRYQPVGALDGEQNIRSREILVDIDYTEGFRLESRASQIVIGNPVIADVTVRDEKYIFISGKSPGRTNMLVYGRDGKLKERYTVMVRDPNTYLTVQKGASDRLHYDCLPNCQRVLRIEDSGTAAEDQRAKISANLQMIDGRAQKAQADEQLQNQQAAGN